MAPNGRLSQEQDGFCRPERGEMNQHSLSEYEYEKERNKLIPQAEKYADEVAGKRPKPKKLNDPLTIAWNNTWNRAYHGKMDELWKGTKI